MASLGEVEPTSLGYFTLALLISLLDKYIVSVSQ